MTEDELDRILAIQFSVAWAGEELRLGWWRTDLTSMDGGGDFLKRLAPRSYVWAGLELVREAVRQIDEAARRRMANRDEVRTLFCLGYALDMKLAERLRWHKLRPDANGVTSPALPGQLARGAFDREAFIAWLAGLGGNGGHAIAPEGRALERDATPGAALVRDLAAALLPLSAQYPVPYCRMRAP